jgi:hypothetical protein
VQRPQGWARLQIPGVEADSPLPLATPTRTTIIDAA